MKSKILILCCLCLLCAGKANAQWVVTDPTNLAQGIINAAKNITQTTTTAKNMISNFKETVKIYEQGKKYYDALKKVNDLVKDGIKVKNTILMVGEISEIYVTSFQLMLQDENFTPEELSAIAFGYTVGGEQQSAQGDEGRGEHHHPSDDRQGAYGRGGQVL